MKIDRKEFLKDNKTQKETLAREGQKKELLLVTNIVEKTIKFQVLSGTNKRVFDNIEGAIDYFNII